MKKEIKNVDSKNVKATHTHVLNQNLIKTMSCNSQQTQLTTESSKSHYLSAIVQVRLDAINSPRKDSSHSRVVNCCI